MSFRLAWLLFLVTVISHSAVTFTFEPPDYSGSPQGVILNGQQGWYLPPASFSGANVHTYTGNARGFVPNPAGGVQFAGGGGRSEYAVDFSSASLWTFSVDVAMIKNFGQEPVPPSALAGRFSLYDADPGGFVVTAVSYWNDLTDDNSTWNLGYTGFGTGDPGLVPGQPWANLAQNHWYRTGMTVDSANRRLVSAWILDPSTGDFAQHFFQNFMFNAEVTPNAIRIFGTFSAAGWDNITITGVPEPAIYLLVGLGLLLIGLVHRTR